MMNGTWNLGLQHVLQDAKPTHHTSCKTIIYYYFKLRLILTSYELLLGHMRTFCNLNQYSIYNDSIIT